MSQTREAWLEAGIAALRPVFHEAGHTIPDNVKVTCGWPSKSALAKKKQRIGECWSDKASEGKVFEVFISPALADPVRVLDVLAHELVHATVGLEAKHGKEFKRCATAIGLEGRMTSTHAGEALEAKLRAMVKTLGDYPHAKLQSMTNGDKKQTTRLKKCECACCGYTVRVTAKWLDMGAPLCPNESCDDYRQPLQVEGAE